MKENNEPYKTIIRQSVQDAIAIIGTQEKLADKSGLSQGAISKYVRGDAMPSGQAAKKLSAASGFPPVRFAPHIFD